MNIYFLPITGLPLLRVKAQVFGLCFLLDTGSNINVLDKRVAEFFQLPISVNKQQQFGIDGTLQTSAVVEMTFSLEEREYKADFSVMDLSSAFGKVEEESGIQIHGLLGCSFMEQRKYPFQCILEKDNWVFTFVYRPEDIKPVLWDVWKIRSTIV